MGNRRTVKNRLPRSSGSQSPPDDASIQELPRTTLNPLPSWVDDLYARISQLAVLIHDAQDIARSPSGWIKTSALIAYNGPSIPGNFDTHSGEIVNTSTFLLKVHGLSQPLTDEYIKGLATHSMHLANEFDEFDAMKLQRLRLVEQ